MPGVSPNKQEAQNGLHACNRERYSGGIPSPRTCRQSSPLLTPYCIEVRQALERAHWASIYQHGVGDRHENRHTINTQKNAKRQQRKRSRIGRVVWAGCARNCRPDTSNLLTYPLIARPTSWSRRDHCHNLRLILRPWRGWHPRSDVAAEGPVWARNRCSACRGTMCRRR